MALLKLPLAPLWVSPFRPFCAFGMAYGVVLMASWLALLAGLREPLPGALAPQLWHGHEMWFGFAMSIICATVLTALPGWAQTPEIRGRALALLVALWALGRAAFWARDLLPVPLVAAGGLALPVALLLALAPQLLRTRERWYLLLLPILAAMIGAQALFAFGHAHAGLRLMLYAVLLLFALKAGVLAPVFTGNHLLASGRGEQARFLPPLEAAAVLSIVALAVVEFAAAGPLLLASAALLASAVHALRLARWRGWRVLDAPLLWMMHAGYAWMVIAFALQGFGALGFDAAQRAALHAFTVGALGSMMLGLMTRVALRHTGRPLAVAPAMRLAFALLQGAAAARVIAPFSTDAAGLASLAGVAWLFAFALYLACFGTLLFSPSLPRTSRSALALEPPVGTAGPARPD